ncbi:MAG: RsmB/NOP family class I SAM-dependent RNA methyltransferase [Candidatus Micrarchaeota archaeon]
MESGAPKAFVDRYCPLVDDADAFLASLGRYLPKSFRVNTLKSSSALVAERFKGYGIGLTRMPYYEDAFISDDPNVGSTLEHFTGAIYMQELVSMLPPLIVREELKEARFVLDACAAPGSKTTQISALMQNRRTIVANDIDYSRIRALKFNLEKTGALNVVVTNQDLRMFPSLQFDLVILDAPCSSEGTIRKNFDLFRTWSEKSVRGCAGLQKTLITKAFDLLAPNGVMIYSTCTFAPEENECILQHLIQEREAKLETIAFDGLKTSKPLKDWSGTTFDPEVGKALRIWPHHNDTGGFFLARVRK